MLTGWIVQSNPKYFNIIGYLTEHVDEQDTWSNGVPKYVNTMYVGDIVYVWKWKGNDSYRGIIGKGTVSFNPNNPKLPDYLGQYWYDQDEKRRVESLPRFNVKYDVPLTKKLLQNPITEDELRSNGLDRLLILRSSGRGIYEVRDQWIERIEKLVDKRRSENRPNLG